MWGLNRSRDRIRPSVHGVLAVAKGTSNVNGNGAKYSEPETYGLLEYRKKYDKAKWAELREFIVTKYREDELTGAAINELCIEEYGCDVGNSTCYRLHKNME